MKISKADLEEQFVRYLNCLHPKPEYLRLFREIVLSTRQDRQADPTRTARELHRRVTDLHERRDRLERAYPYEGNINDETYHRQKAKLDEEIALAEIAAHDARLEELDVEGLRGFAEHLLSNAGGSGWSSRWISDSACRRSSSRRG